VRLARRLSLRTRLALLAGVGAMVVLSVGALLLYQNISGELSRAITDELTIRMGDLTANVEAGTLPTAPSSVLTQVVGPDGSVLSPRRAEAVLTADELARALKEPIVVDREVAGVGEHARLLARPIARPGGGEVVGVVATSTSPLVRARDRLTVVLVVAGPVLAAAIAAAAWILTGAALRPVRRMTSEAATISMTETGARLPQPEGEDEIAELGRTLNGMLARIETTIAHERAFIDDAAHELRSPIAVLRGELELAADDPGDTAAVSRGLASALEETDRLSRLSEDLLTLARADAGQLAPSHVTTEVLDAARAAVGRYRVRDELSLEVSGEPLIVRGDPLWIRQIVTNLVANADRHAKRRIVVSTSVADDRGRLVVADDGPGFPSDLLPQAFDRFTRGDGSRSRAGGGTGLGLAIVASLTHALGGVVTATNGPPLGGARVVVDLPVVQG
jgi:two-component system, OmpR family, sensor kinase